MSASLVNLKQSPAQEAVDDKAVDEALQLEATSQHWPRAMDALYAVIGVHPNNTGYYCAGEKGFKTYSIYNHERGCAQRQLLSAPQISNISTCKALPNC